jgi:hypothetical protein
MDDLSLLKNKLPKFSYEFVTNPILKLKIKTEGRLWRAMPMRWNNGLAPGAPPARSKPTGPLC